MEVNVRTPQRYEILKRKHRRPAVRLLGPEQSDDTMFGVDVSSLGEDEADAIMEWSMHNELGVRMSFDIWEFKTQEDMTAFILRWC